MDKKTIERANKLERQIKSLSGFLKSDCMFVWKGFAIHYVVNFGPIQALAYIAMKITGFIMSPSDFHNVTLKQIDEFSCDNET